jgi:hypothetical protein
VIDFYPASEHAYVSARRKLRRSELLRQRKQQSTMLATRHRRPQASVHRRSAEATYFPSLTGLDRSSIVVARYGVLVDVLGATGRQVCK